MSYTREHRRLKPVLDKARELNIATNPAPEALFDPLVAGFNLWCTPSNHPDGWEEIPMVAGAFAKPCEFVASVYWGWTEERITHLELSTAAYALRDHHRVNGRRDIHNRPEDVTWATKTVRWLFEQAGVPMLPIRVED